ncbi:MAG: phytanoyl-CoA dioxygenase family protein [Candidatus Sumerlaeaceae bacterium]|nr:phytanoyl-CoA dioxygenase family protein [Candidatus Sumerlaeaceae bacterium]
MKRRGKAMKEIPAHLLPTDADVGQYRGNGFWVSKPLFSADEIAVLRERHGAVIAGDYATSRPPYDRNIEPGAAIKALVKIDNSFWCDSTIARHLINPVIGAIAAKLVGVRGIRLWHDQLLHKPPDTGAPGNVGWHQDHHYWQCAQPAELLTAWLALDDATSANGCMQMVPGSHNWGLLDASDFFEQDMEKLRDRMAAAAGREFAPVCVPVPAGAVSFHHCLTIHGSGPNKTDKARRAWAIHLMPDGTRYKAGTPADPHMNVRLLGGLDGDAFTGPWFPLLYSENPPGNAWETAG